MLTDKFSRKGLQEEFNTNRKLLRASPDAERRTTGRPVAKKDVLWRVPTGERWKIRRWGGGVQPCGTHGHGSTVERSNPGCVVARNQAGCARVGQRNARKGGQTCTWLACQDKGRGVRGGECQLRPVGAGGGTGRALHLNAVGHRGAPCGVLTSSLAEGMQMSPEQEVAPLADFYRDANNGRIGKTARHSSGLVQTKNCDSGPERSFTGVTNRALTSTTASAA